MYLGIQANNVPALGQWSVLSEAKVGGTATPFDDVFTNDVAIISNIWEIAAADPPGVMLVPGTSVFWVNWTLPDAGFDLVSGTTANPDNWMNESGVTIRQVGAKRWALIDQTNLPGSQGGYFALTRRQFTQLQVLLPGETNAPGTASGKIGLPTPVSLGAGGNISVTVNACDPQWNILNVYGDTIHVAATDTQATQPADTVLVTGITVQQFQLKTQGTTTFTASDTSDPSKTANTSTAVTVGP